MANFFATLVRTLTGIDPAGNRPAPKAGIQRAQLIPRYWVGIGLVCAISASGCTRVRQVRECRALISETNQRLEQISHQAQDAQLRDPSKLAQSYDGLADFLLGYRFNNPTNLSAPAQTHELGAVFRETAAVLRKYQASDFIEGGAGRDELLGVKERQASLARQLDLSCR